MADSTGEDGGPAQVPTASAQVNEAQPAPAVEGAVDAPASHNATPDHASTATNGDAPQANSSSLEDTAAGKSKSASPAQQGSNEGAPIAPPATQAMDKRKAGGKSATASNNSPRSTPGPAEAVARRAAAVPLPNNGREINMMTFMKSKAKLLGGKLIADDGTELGVNDHVYLVCEPPGDPYYLCRIMEFLHVKSGDASSPVDSLRVNWFYRPRDCLSHKKDAKLSKETIAALEADRAERAKRPKWVLDEPVGYVHRGEDHPNKDSKNTAQLLFKMPPQGEHSERGLDDKPLADEKAIDAYMERAKQVAKTHVNVPPFGTNFLDKAIQLYYDNNYDAEAALKKLKKVDRYKDLKEPVLTKEELKKFEEGVAKYGSEHRLIRLHMKTDLPNSVIVRFYYLWKKTPQGKVIWGSYGGRKGKKKRPDMDWEDVEEVAKKVAQGGGRAWKRRIDEELLRELIAANEAAQLGTPEASSANASLEGSVEPPKKKSKTGDGETTTKKKEKPAPAPKQPTPPPPPIVPEQPKWRTLPCAVCKTLEIGVEQPISCAHCKLTVHKQCYGMADQVVPSKWVCDQCSNDRTPTVSTDYACTLCPVHETKLELFEPPKVSHKKKTDREREKERLERELIDKAKQDYTKRQTELNRPALPREPLKKTDGNNWMHVLCAVFTPEIRFSNARVLERAENQGMIPMSRYEMVCKVCKARDHQGACISCSHTGCNANFHVTCAHEAGYTFGFDVAPQKASRKDRQTVALGSETGYMTAAVWCKEHSVKTIVHPMSEMVDDTGRNALQLYVETYKQADIALTGTARKANLLSQSTKSTPPAIPAPASTIAVNRRVSIASTVATGRGARNSSLGLAAKTPEGEEGTPVSNTVSEAPERKYDVQQRAGHRSISEAGTGCIS
ncbi:putative PHD type zinc finger protein with BAH domain-containing protein [Zalaria obscura]|uniref:PHD type zinc finger protein with BAH domain-containing protein n=1 Tax=Zalaria obscura TaxID=2024903 RepID=A0ACC3SQZ0_9PEZI